MNSRPILVTGAHRSGTTWVGKMISVSPQVGYIDEPFNLHHPPGICGAKFAHWFPYITDENGPMFYEYIKKTLNFEYDVGEEIKTVRTPKDLVRIFSRILRDYPRFSWYRFRKVRPLVKDPIAIFSAEWLANTFDMDVVVLIRHPAAFASSLKRLNLTHPFSDFLSQPLLIKNHLYPFEKEIKLLTHNAKDIIDQAILLWRLVYYMVIKYRIKHDDWIFVRHEDLSCDPLLGFQDIFSRLDLEFTSRVRAVIQKYSSPMNPQEAPQGGISLKLNSKLNIYNWKHRLTKFEIERIREGVEDIAKEFYSDDDW